jgi:putative FmdB family regulatory protein
MPTYNLRCKKCSHEFQKTQKMSDPTPLCPKCAGDSEFLIKKSSFILKGKGWFNTGGY